jgi:hypothetical protein
MHCHKTAGKHGRKFETDFFVVVVVIVGWFECFKLRHFFILNPDTQKYPIKANSSQVMTHFLAKKSHLEPAGDRQNRSEHYTLENCLFNFWHFIHNTE